MKYTEADAMDTSSYAMSEGQRCNVSNEARKACLDEQQRETTMMMIPTLVYLCLLSVTGIVGNCLVLVVYPLRFTRSPIRTFIMATAVFDLLINTIVIPGEIYDIFHSWDFNHSGLCKARLYFKATTTIASTFLLLAIAVTRYRKICHPFGWQVTMRHTKAINVAIPFLALLFSVPCAITNGLQNRETKYTNISGRSCLVDEHIGMIWHWVTFALFIVLFLSVCVPLVALYVLIGITATKHIKSGHVVYQNHTPMGNTASNNVSNIATTMTPDEVSTSQTSEPNPFAEQDRSDASSEEEHERKRGNAKLAHISLRKRILLRLQGKKCHWDSTMGGQLKKTAYDYDDLAVCCRHSIQRESTLSFTGFYQDAGNSAAGEISVNVTEFFVNRNETLSLIKNKIHDELSRSDKCDSSYGPRDLTKMSSERSCDIGGSEMDEDTNIESDTNTDIFRTPADLKGSTEKSQDVAQITKFSIDWLETSSVPEPIYLKAKQIPTETTHTGCLDSSQIPIQTTCTGCLNSSQKQNTTSENKTQAPVPNLVSTSPSPIAGNATHRLKRSHRPKRKGHSTCMLIVMSGVFIGAFLPFLVMEPFRETADRAMGKASLVMYHLFLRSYLVNSAVNPIIYNLSNAKFRRECVKLVTRS